MKGLRIGDLAITVPVIQGGMGVGISLSGLAAAVANEGGVGVISSAGLGLLYRHFLRTSWKQVFTDLWRRYEKPEKKQRVSSVSILWLP